MSALVGLRAGHDVGRAEQWIRAGEAIAARRHLPAVSAFCRTHYGGILTAAGRWPEAEATLTEAVRLWGLGQRAYRGAALEFFDPDHIGGIMSAALAS